MKNLSYLFSLLLFISAVVFIFPQETDDKIKSLTVVREEKLKFGLNNEIIELINSLVEEKNKDHNSTLKNIFSTTRNSQMKEHIIKLFTVTDSADLLDLTAEIINNREYENRSIVISSLRYLSEKGSGKYNNIFEQMLDDINPEYRIESIKALSRTENKKYTDMLIEQYRDEEDVSVKLAILLDIGKLKDSSAVDFLVEIVRDQDMDRTSRQYAINSLGDIQDEKSFNDLLAAFQDTDPLIRIYAISSISRFNNRGVQQVIYEALKDENWRIRKEAVISAGKTGNNDFTDILIYRADNDPVEDIRIESVKSLGTIGGRKAFDFLREKAEGLMINFKIRSTAFNILINNDLDNSLKTVALLFDREWASSNRVPIETFSSQLAAVTSGKLDSYFEKMLEHSSISVRISGLRGIRLNKIRSLKEKVEILAQPHNPVSIRNHALAVLESF